MIFENRFLRFKPWFLLIPFGLSVLMVLIGTVFQYRGSRMDAPLLPILAVESLFYVQIALAGIFFYLGKGRRWVILFVTIISLLFAVFCEGIAGMSLTNVWL